MGDILGRLWSVSLIRGVLFARNIGVFMDGRIYPVTLAVSTRQAATISHHYRSIVQGKRLDIYTGVHNSLAPCYMKRSSLILGTTQPEDCIHQACERDPHRSQSSPRLLAALTSLV